MIPGISPILLSAGAAGPYLGPELLLVLPRASLGLGRGSGASFETAVKMEVSWSLLP